MLRAIGVQERLDYLLACRVWPTGLRSELRHGATSFIDSSASRRRIESRGKIPQRMPEGKRGIDVPPGIDARSGRQELMSRINTWRGVFRPSTL
jgi:hypothetical protein